MTLNILDDSHNQIWVRTSDSTITQERVGLRNVRDFHYHRDSDPPIESKIQNSADHVARLHGYL